VLRDQPELFGPVASTPTAWRIIERAANDPDGLAGLRAARAHARARAWAAGADPKPELLIVNADATLVLGRNRRAPPAHQTYRPQNNSKSSDSTERCRAVGLSAAVPV
jgi:hypothetical protein